MQSSKPNVLLINADDLGYGDLGCFGSQVNHTPYLDKLAEHGMRFTSAYAASPVCSPSRASLMTGCYPPRVGFNSVLFPGEELGLNNKEYTIGKMFKDAGYSTMIVGKWHCGDQPEFMPSEHGFDRYYGLPYSNDMGIQRVGSKNPPLPLMSDNEIIEEQPDQKCLTERYVERCIEYMRANKDNPFFLYFAQMHVHTPLYAADRFVSESENGDFGACVGEMDWACGALFAELKRLNILDNTLIIFTSDNGSRAAAGASNAPLRGKKWTTWEGGMRIPMIAYWKDHIPAGTVNDHIFCHIDFLPTLSALIGGKLPELPIDGLNQLDTFCDPSVCVRDEMVYCAPDFCGDRKNITQVGGNINAYRKGNWKLHTYVNGNLKDCPFNQGENVTLLYDLDTDIGETTDVSEKYPEVVKELTANLEKWQKDLGKKREGYFGTGCRAPGVVDDPKPLTYYNEDHPYIIAIYDRKDAG